MWDLPGPGMELMSLALQGRFLTTGKPGKPLKFIKRRQQGDFPGGPVTKIPCSQCRGPRFDACSGILHATTKSILKLKVPCAAVQTQSSQINKGRKQREMEVKV